MNLNEMNTEWVKATASLRTQIRQDAYEAHLASIKLEGKKPHTEGQKRTAQNMAKAAELQTLAKMREYMGVENPIFHDPIWGPDAEAKTATPAPAKDEKAVIDFLKTCGWSDFATSLARQHDDKGTLSEKQWASARKMKAKMDAKAKAQIVPEDSGSTDDLDLSGLRSGYYSVPDGDTRLKVRIARPTKASKWHGFIFVSDGGAYGARKNYGRQDEANGSMYSGFIQDQLKAIVADPEEAMRAYGRLTGSCGACGRVLEDASSIEAGIGPICESKGW